MSCQTVMEVTSEIFPHFERDVDSKPALNTKYIISKFTFQCPRDGFENGTQELQKDEDGDYIIEKRHSMVHDETVFLEHSMSTELRLVGLQIWRGALLLADFIIHSRAALKGLTLLELGSGVGLTSIVASVYAGAVICTDIDLGDILKLIISNFARNKNLVRAQVDVCALNFFDTQWSELLEMKMKEVSVVFAADVIYDNDVTEAFVKTVSRILSIPPRKTLYIALEKRYVFTIADLDSVAPCYEHLLSCLEAAKETESWKGWRVEQVALDFPQYFNYERVKELVMWKISS